MVLKEYMLRGMAERILILTPASLVGQWRDEMESKFGIDFATSHDPLLRSDPAALLGPAAGDRLDRRRRAAGAGRVARRHELRRGGGRRGAPPARPVERQLPAGEPPAEALPAAAVGDAGAEQPAGTVQPADPAAARHLQDAEGVPLGLHGARQAARTGEPRAAARPDAQSDGAQHARAGGAAAAAAARLDACARVPDAAEAACYRDLSALAREVATGGQVSRSAVLQHLLAAAGSSPAAAAAAVARFAARHPEEHALGGAARPLSSAIAVGAKEAALLRCWRRTQPRRSWCSSTIATAWRIWPICCAARSTPFALFDGGMTGPAEGCGGRGVPRRVPLLLCSESGGEGRNLQFCNTLINFDIPVEPDGDRAAHRPHRPDRPDARGVRLQPGHRRHDRGRGAAHPR